MQYVVFGCKRMYYYSDGFCWGSCVSQSLLSGFRVVFSHVNFLSYPITQHTCNISYSQLFSLFFLQDIFLCMLRNLFEEYRFFPQYPDKELHTTACLFGGIIEQGLVT